MIKIITKLNFLIGIAAIIIFKGVGWYGAEVSRKILIFVYDLLRSIFSSLPLADNYGLIDYIFETVCTYAISSMIYAWITIFLPFLIFKKIFKFNINWRPAIYLLFLWFGFDLFFTSLFIWNNDLDAGFSYAYIAKVFAIIGNWLGVYVILFYALKSIKENKISNG